MLQRVPFVNSHRDLLNDSLVDDINTLVDVVAITSLSNGFVAIGKDVVFKFPHKRGEIKNNDELFGKTRAAQQPHRAHPTPHPANTSSVINILTVAGSIALNLQVFTSKKLRMIERRGEIIKTNFRSHHS